MNQSNVKTQKYRFNQIIKMDVVLYLQKCGSIKKASFSSSRQIHQHQVTNTLRAFWARWLCFIISIDLLTYLIATSNKHIRIQVFPQTKGELSPPTPNHNGNHYLPWKSMFASTEFIDVWNAKYLLREEDNEKSIRIIKAGATMSLNLLICG